MTDNLVRYPYGYGDWLNVEEETEKAPLNTAFFAYTAWLMSKMADIIENKERRKYYSNMFEDIKEAFNREFVQKDGRIVNGTQCIYTLALKFDLISKENRKKAIEYLSENINKKGGHMVAGFVSVGYLLPQLTENGRNDLAYKLIANDTYPSWGYSIVNGATTIWERWNSYTKETGFGDVAMNSFNHYSLGSCGEWMFRYVLGIEAEEESPGYRHYNIKPYPDPSMEYAKGSYASIVGNISVEWKYGRGEFTMGVEIPANTAARVFVPSGKKSLILENGQEIHKTDGIKVKGWSEGYTEFECGSGKYYFTVREDQV
jgi:alpha-L-rhamnosidase